MPKTTKSAAAKARVDAHQGLCSINNFTAMNKQGMINHLRREKVIFDASATRPELEITHSSALSAFNIAAAAATNEDILNLGEIYEDKSVVVNNIGVNHTSTFPIPRVILLQPPSVVIAPYDIFQDLFRQFHDTTLAKANMELDLITAIDDCGIYEPSDVALLLSPHMDSELQAVVSCLKGSGKARLLSILERLRLHDEVTNMPTSVDISSPSSKVSLVTIPPQNLATLSAKVGQSAIITEAPVLSPIVQAQEAEIAALKKSLALAMGKTLVPKGIAVKGKRRAKSSALHADDDDDNDDIDDDSDDEVDDEITSRSSNGESIDSSDRDDRRSVVSAHRKIIPLTFATKKSDKKYKALSALYISTGKEIFPVHLRVISFPELLHSALSGVDESSIICFNLELGVFSTRFREGSHLGIHKRNMVLVTKEYIGPAQSPTVVNRGQFIRHSGLNNTTVGYPQTIAQCMLMVDSLLFQVCHSESSLSDKTSMNWTVHLLQFKADVGVLIQSLGVTDSPKGKHIVNRAAVCRFFYCKLNQAAVNEDPTLLSTHLFSDWRNLTDFCTDGSILKPDVLSAIITLSGYRCEDHGCGALGGNKELCSTCKLQSPMSAKLFPSSKQPTSEQRNNDYRKDKGAARKAFLASPAGAAVRQLDANDPAAYSAFIAACPKWSSSSAPDSKESASSSKTYDAATCHEYMYKHQAEFDLPVGLRSV